MHSEFFYAFALTLTGINFAFGTKDVLGNEGGSVFLPCRGDNGVECFWTASFPDGTSELAARSNDAVKMRRYELTDFPQFGDCSLNISGVDSSDTAILVCTIRHNPPVIIYNLTVGVQPNDPLIEYKFQNYNDGETVIIETPAEINCIVKGGKPGAEVTWENANYYPFNVSITSNGDLIDVINTLKIENFQQKSKPEIKITCTANHPLYPYHGHQKSITITVGYEYETRNVIIYDNGTYAFCFADGIPKPFIQWQFKEKNVIRWKNIATSENIKIGKTGEYRCQAGNGVNGNFPIISNILDLQENEIPISNSYPSTSTSTSTYKAFNKISYLMASVVLITTLNITFAILAS